PAPDLHEESRRRKELRQRSLHRRESLRVRRPARSFPARLHFGRDGRPPGGRSRRGQRVILGHVRITGTGGRVPSVVGRIAAGARDTRPLPRRNPRPYNVPWLLQLDLHDPSAPERLLVADDPVFELRGRDSQRPRGGFYGVGFRFPLVMHLFDSPVFSYARARLSLSGFWTSGSSLPIFWISTCWRIVRTLEKSQ